MTKVRKALVKAAFTEPGNHNYFACYGVSAAICPVSGGTTQQLGSAAWLIDKMPESLVTPG
jgi:hypothetical protein